MIRQYKATAHIQLNPGDIRVDVQDEEGADICSLSIMLAALVKSHSESSSLVPCSLLIVVKDAEPTP